MVSIHPLISNSSIPLSKLLGIVPNAPITIGITVTFMFHRFLISLGRSKYLSLPSFSLIFPMWISETAKSFIKQVLSFCNLLMITRFGQDLHDSYWIPFATHSCIGLNCFCANLLHSLIWLIVSFLSPNNVHLLFRCVLSIWYMYCRFVLMALFCAAI